MLGADSVKLDPGTLTVQALYIPDYQATGSTNLVIGVRVMNCYSIHVSILPPLLEGNALDHRGPWALRFRLNLAANNVA